MHHDWPHVCTRSWVTCMPAHVYGMSVACSLKVIQLLIQPMHTLLQSHAPWPVSIARACHVNCTALRFDIGHVQLKLFAAFCYYCYDCPCRHHTCSAKHCGFVSVIRYQELYIDHTVFTDTGIAWTCFDVSMAMPHCRTFQVGQGVNILMQAHLCEVHKRVCAYTACCTLRRDSRAPAQPRYLWDRFRVCFKRVCVRKEGTSLGSHA